MAEEKKRPQPVPGHRELSIPDRRIIIPGRGGQVKNTPGAGDVTNTHKVPAPPTPKQK